MAIRWPAKRGEILELSGGAVTELSDLTDVATSTQTNRNVLASNGSSFYSRPLVEADISDLQSYLTSFTETNDLSAAVTWANIPDANVPESAVTQHEAALTILESQITDGSILARTGAAESITAVYSFRGTGGTMLQALVSGDANGLQIGEQNTDQVYLRPRSSDGLTWDINSDIYYDRSTGVWSIETALAVTGAVTGSNLNVSNWDTAYGWGDHSSTYSLLGHTHDSITDTNLLDKSASETISGVYSFDNYTLHNNNKTLYFKDSGGTARHGIVVPATDIMYIGSAALPTVVRGTSVDVDAALTATSYGGVAEANLVDKSATESIAGIWTWTGSLIAFSSTTPTFRYSETDAATDEGQWQMQTNGGSWKVQAWNDAFSVVEQPIVISRTGTNIDEITFAGDDIALDVTNIGFYGAAPASKPTITGSRGGNAALADLLTELATLGLITDSSS